MSDIAVHVEKLSKQYRTGETIRHDTLRDQLGSLIRNPFRKQKDSSRRGSEVFWALKEVSFDVPRGEILGVIGRNGAGKSTLLKILSRITAPTQGRVDLNGRVGSLLEVGTGFHPELTGRENIYMNGSILGMTRAEIKSRFDEIVDFSGVEKFIDTPVKRYSSGMYTRLAFAVAAHLNPDILLIDEVLSVGDAEFREKSLGKMEQVAGQGRTVLFVSHQMNMVRKLCSRCIWLADGQIRMNDACALVVTDYEASTRKWPAAGDDSEQNQATGFMTWEIVEPKAEQPNWLNSTGPTTIRIAMHTNKTLQDGTLGIGLLNHNEQVMWSWSKSRIELEPGTYELNFQSPGFPLMPGAYQWVVSLREADELVDLWYCTPEMIVTTRPLAHLKSDKWIPLLNIPCEFEVKKTEGVSGQ